MYRIDKGQWIGEVKCWKDEPLGLEWLHAKEPTIEEWQVR